MLGNTILAASKTSSSSSSTFLLIIVVLVVLFYFVMIRPQAKRRRAVQEQQRNVEPGARVRTTAGMYATVVAVDGDDVILEVAPGVQSRYLKRAIMETLPDDSGTDDGAEPFTPGEDAPPADDESTHDADEVYDDEPASDAAAEHTDGDVTAHLGGESPNGSAAPSQDESKTPDNV